MAINLIDLTDFLVNPNLIDKEATRDLDEIIQEFPFFQAARAIHLHGLKKQHSYKYNVSLKQAAAHTTDRSILFDFITADKFEVDQIYPGSELIKSTRETAADPSDTRLTEDPVKHNQRTEGDVLIGKPIQFRSNDQRSFFEWMQLSSFKPIERENDTIETKQRTEKSSKSEKFELIEKFIATNPKIGTLKELENPSIIDSSTVENEQLMTETLAHVYLEQKKYEKAMTAFQILSLKYPEKSSFFALQIEKIKELQSNN
ncbi:MAG: hypothetical protein WBN16_12665 [Lutimonas sp.]